MSVTSMFAGAAAFAAFVVAPAFAQQPDQPEPCPRLIASRPTVQRAAVQPDELLLSFIGHATFTLETPQGVRVATDYNDYVRPRGELDVITMNKAHDTHFSNRPAAAIPHVLRGWNPRGGPAEVDLTVKDLRIRNVVTNIRDWGGQTEYDANSIFVFEASQLCVAHLGHLHHELTEEHLKQLGRVDVALAPVDGGFTLGQQGMINVLKTIQPPLIIPMHFFGPSTLRRFLGMASEHWPIETANNPTITLKRDTLPTRTRVLVLPGH
jgi:L-ascorbate metabolism protein UlaG (beta-lactamase superfamily)